MKWTCLAVALAIALPVLAKNPPAVFPTPGAAETVLDNERVTAWDFKSSADKPAGMTSGSGHPLDTVVIELANASVEGKGQRDSYKASFRIGQVHFDKKSDAKPASFLEQHVGTALRRTIFIELKNAAVESIKNTSGKPEAFPRDGAKKLLENDRVIVWDYRWQMGKPTPMHFHTLDTVTVALEVGEVKSTTLDGASTVNASTFGKVRFNPRGRIHTEELVKGAARAIIVELKQP